MATEQSKSPNHWVLTQTRLTRDQSAALIRQAKELQRKLGWKPAPPAGGSRDASRITPRP